MKSLGSGEFNCPGGTFLPDTRWQQKWHVVCLAGLSTEDIEDIYLFGIMITGFLLIGDGLALVYWKLKKAVTAVINPTRLPAMIEAMGRASTASRIRARRDCPLKPTPAGSLHLRCWHTLVLVWSRKYTPGWLAKLCYTLKENKVHPGAHEGLLR